jgi:hypothetical protein
MHAVIKIIFYIDNIKNADNWVAAILDMQISECNVISGYEKRKLFQTRLCRLYKYNLLKIFKHYL